MGQGSCGCKKASGLDKQKENNKKTLKTIEKVKDRNFKLLNWFFTE
jgi:hypothetical protein